MKDKNYWINHLNLLPHPEGGYYKEMYRSNVEVQPDQLPYKSDDSRNLMTSIYFLLDDDNYSAFHRIKSDELWFYHGGDTLVIHSISPNGDYRKRHLGNGSKSMESLSITINAGDWFASEVLNQSGFVLVSCVVSPGFDFNDFELADIKLANDYPQHQSIIKRLLVRQ